MKEDAIGILKTTLEENDNVFYYLLLVILRDQRA